MKVKNTIFIVGTIITLTSFATATDHAEQLFDTKCAICHSKTKPTDMSKVIAPALMGIMRHVKMNYPNKDEAVKFMVDYVFEPAKDKSICMAKKIEHFGLMPSQKGNITEDELIKVTSWMFDHFPADNFRGMGHRNRQGR